jgi:UDP-glucose 4-epimerase
MGQGRMSVAGLEGKRILVTGGCGFIGSHLVHALWRDNEVVVVDDLSSGRLANLEGCRVQFYHCSILDAIEPLFAGVEVVFHTAANVTVQGSIDDPCQDARTNVEGLLRVLEAGRRQGVKRFVFSASSAVYGEALYLPINEEHPLRPDSPYAVSKLAGEYYVRLYHDLYGLATVSLRYFNVYGPRQVDDGPYSGVISIFARCIREQQPLVIYGDGHQTRDFVHVQDVVQANLSAAQPDFAAQGQVINVGAGVTTSVLQLAQLMGGSDLTYAPARPGDVRESVADLSLARRSLGFAPTVSLREGLRAYVDWLERGG